MRLVELGLQCDDLFHLCGSQRGLAQIDGFEAGLEQVGPHQLCIDQAASIEYGPRQESTGQVDAVQVQFVEPGGCPDRIAFGNQGHKRVPPTLGGSALVADHPEKVFPGNSRLAIEMTVGQPGVEAQENDDSAQPPPGNS